MTACVASSSIRKGRYIKVTSSLHVAECLPGEDWIGVSLNAASTGQAVTIVGPGGFADVRAGAAITAGDELEIIQLGSVAPLASGDKCGIALSTAAGNGSRVQVAVLPKQASGTAVLPSGIHVRTQGAVSIDNNGETAEFAEIAQAWGPSGVLSFTAPGTLVTLEVAATIIVTQSVTWAEAAGGLRSCIPMITPGSATEVPDMEIATPPVVGDYTAVGVAAQSHFPANTTIGMLSYQTSGNALNATAQEMVVVAFPD